MCTAKELITYLQTLPSDMEVEILQKFDGNYYTGTKWESLELGAYSDSCNVYTDILYLGED